MILQDTYNHRGNLSDQADHVLEDQSIFLA